MEQTKKFSAKLYLPKNGKQIWTAFMQGESPVPSGIYEGQPIVMATTTFKNGIMVSGGVMKSNQPDEFNIKFFNTFDTQGHLISEPYQPIDPSDHEDFHQKCYIFNLNDDESVEYHLKIVERSE